jgi:hypothetical protein
MSSSPSNFFKVRIWVELLVGFLVSLGICSNPESSWFWFFGWGLPDQNQEDPASEDGFNKSVPRIGRV